MYGSTRPDEDAGATTSAAIAELSRELLALDLDLPDPDRVATIRVLTDLTNTIGALQARLVSDLDASRRARDDEAGIPREERRGVGAIVAWARRESPHAGQVAVGVATAVVREMPHTFAAMCAGVLSEYRARLLVTETACLSLEDRAAVDQAVCADVGALEGGGSRRLAG